MILWRYLGGTDDPLASDAFSTMDAVFALEGELVTQDSLCRVLRVRIRGECFYVKQYFGNGKTARQRWFGLRQWFGTPRVQTEWMNLLRFAQWGIPSARVVAYGLERHRGAFRRGALVTAEIPDAADLATMSLRGEVRLKCPAWVRAVSRQVAQIARRMHDEGFAHNDLKWRNLLVSGNSMPKVFLIDCPCGGFWRGPLLAYRVIKDLACLDKVAKYQLSRTQRLRFFLDYVGRARLTPEDKKRLNRIIHFFDGRE